MPTTRPRFTATLDPQLAAQIEEFTNKAVMELLKIGLRNLQQEGKLPAPSAIQFGEAFQRLDRHGKEVVTAVLQLEIKRTQATMESVTKRSGLVYRFMMYDIPISAGTGNWLDESDGELVELYRAPPKGTDYILRVQGDSMEPLIPDGSMVFISRNTNVEYGDIAAVFNDGKSYLKRLRRNGLESINPKYQIIKPDDDFRVLGKYIGLATDDYF